MRSKRRRSWQRRGCRSKSSIRGRSSRSTGTVSARRSRKPGACSSPTKPPAEQGQTLATIDSEKVTMELPSPVGGVVAEYLVQAGDTVPVGSPLAVIVAADEFEHYASKEA